MPESVFAKYEPKAWPYVFDGSLHVDCIVGGIPTDPNVAEGWIRTKLAPPDDLLRAMVEEVMVERGLTEEEARKIVNDTKHLSGFKRDDERGLFIEGRQLKAAIKEAAMCAAAVGKIPLKKWGLTGKSLGGFLAEHVQVIEDRLYLGVNSPSSVEQRFLHKMTAAGPISAIQYEEVVRDAKIDFTITTDWDFSEEDWAMIWLTGHMQGIGAVRSQGFGRYVVTRWERTRG